MACEQIFLQGLREHGLRLTPQREMILAVMHEVEGLATAEEIYERVHARSSAVDISTIYRTLELLRDLELVACVDTADGQRRYELLGVHGPHIHLICRSCDKVIGIELAEGRAFAERLRARYGFVADLDRLSIEGLCHECALSERSAE